MFLLKIVILNFHIHELNYRNTLIKYKSKAYVLSGWVMMGNTRWDEEGFFMTKFQQQDQVMIRCCLTIMSKMTTSVLFMS